MISFDKNDLHRPRLYRNQPCSRVWHELFHHHDNRYHEKDNLKRTCIICCNSMYIFLIFNEFRVFLNTRLKEKAMVTDRFHQTCVRCDSENNGEYLSKGSVNSPGEADRLMEFHSQKRNQRRRRDTMKTHHGDFSAPKKFPRVFLADQFGIL